MGVYLLETESNIDKWLDLFNLFKEKQGGNLGQDLLLEAAIFSANPSKNIENMFPILLSENGKLLQRFLNRFLYSASFPNQIALMISAACGDEEMTKIIAENRDPYWLYWIPLIQTLYKFKEDTKKVCPLLTSKIVDKWLRFSKKDWLARSEAAEIAVELSEDLLALKLSNTRCLSNREHSENIFRAGIASCKEEEERSIAFILTACSRKPPSGNVSTLLEQYNSEDEDRRNNIKKKENERRKRPAFVESSFYGSGPTPDPWTEGPILQIDNDFQNTCLGLNSKIDALHPLITFHPKIAIEAILALLIEHPKPEKRGGGNREEKLGLGSLHGWYPPFFTNGPFFFFLNTHHEYGIDLIIAFINFVTDRWVENRSKWEPDSICIEIKLNDITYKYFGDHYFYYWHRGVPTIPDSIVSALMSLEKWLYDKLENDETKSIAMNAIDKLLKKGNSLAFIGLIISVAKKYQELFIEKFLPLLSVPEFYWWDFQHVMVSEKTQMMGWSQKGQVFYKLAEEWNSMNHRKEMLNKIGPFIFIQHESTRESFDGFREEWMKRAECGNLTSLNPNTLENLIIWFDLSNWKTKIDPKYGEIFYCEVPQKINEKRDKSLLKLNDKNSLLTLPMNFRQVLDGEIELTEEESDNVWNAIQAADTIEVDGKDPDKDILNKNNSICGGIAVLFINFPKWVANHPNKKAWCIDKLIEIILAPHCKDEFDHDLSISNWKWDCFCAEVFPIIWLEDPDKELFRKCISSLATNRHYETVRILFNAASKLRIFLNEHFKQLENLTKNYVSFKRSTVEERNRSKRQQILNDWISNETKLFLAKDYSRCTKSLSTIIKEGNKDASNEKPYQYRYFDFGLMKSIFDWIPTLNEANSVDERNEWLFFWKDLLSITIDLVSEDKNDRGEFRGTPSDWDCWILKKMSMQILDMKKSENPHEFWEPILNLGAPGHYWVEDFFSEWFFFGIGLFNEKSNFDKKWKEMVEYAFDSNDWNETSGVKWFHWPDLWCKLLGMDYSISRYWESDKKNIIYDMAPFYKKWATNHLSEPKSAHYFIHFLMLPACESILIDGIIDLELASRDVDFFTDRHYKIQNPLATLLEFSWNRYKDDVLDNSEAYTAFKKILKKLIDLQNIQAIEFQSNKFNR